MVNYREPRRTSPNLPLRTESVFIRGSHPINTILNHPNLDQKGGERPAGDKTP